jgi:hypothetical protein
MIINNITIIQIQQEHEDDIEDNSPPEPPATAADESTPGILVPRILIAPGVSIVDDADLLFSQSILLLIFPLEIGVTQKFDCLANL